MTNDDKTLILWLIGLSLIPALYIGRLAMIPRGIKNNNPGNIKHSKNMWDGQSKQQTDLVFVQFQSSFFGIRAITKIIRNYRKYYGIDTINSIIRRWSATDQDAYVSFVEKTTGIPRQAPLELDEDTMFKIVSAIIQFENGQNPYAVDDVYMAVRAGLS
jgi:hypothetical protein